MSNPGPASAVTPNYIAAQQNALRCIGFAKGVNLGVAGDTQMTALAMGSFLPTNVITANSAQGATVDVHLATVGVYTGVAQAGTVVLTTAAITGQTTGTAAKVTAATNAATMIVGSSTLYVNVGTTVAGGVIDVYVYGYDLQ